MCFPKNVFKKPHLNFQRELNASPKKGFTLIEVLIVVAVIGILSGFVLVNTKTSRAKSRDSRRYQDLAQLRIAVELYRADNNRYPSTAGAWWSVCPGSCGPHDTSGSNGWIPNLAPTYIASLPTDPSGCTRGGTCKGYIYRSDGVDYKIATDWTAEVGDECGVGQRFYDPRRCGTNEKCGFCSVWTTGARNW